MKLDISGVPLILQKSPPARGRGLKHDNLIQKNLHRWSPPARGRGLKLIQTLTRIRLKKSPPARGRGLKL